MSNQLAQKRPHVAGAAHQHTQAGVAPIDRILQHLSGVRKSGDGFRANCPNGHRQAKGSLSLRMVDDGKVLLHCFACNDTQGVLSALGLHLADLYERPLRPGGAISTYARRSVAHLSHALNATAYEAQVVVAAAVQMISGRSLDLEELARLQLAVDRIIYAREVAA